MKKPDGGQAFPHPDFWEDVDGNLKGVGMTLRDYFAGQALVGILAANRTGFNDVAAEEAYEAADAMLAEREKE